MRTAHKVWSGIAAGVFGLVAVTDLAGSSVPPAGTVASSSTLPASSGAASSGAIPAAAPSVAPAVAGPAAVSASVIDVIDGDTFRLASGDEVRVLGIDSCEAATPGGGRATAAARARLLSAPVTLTAEPGVDRDRYGRMLRYVGVGGTDFASSMVTQDHTAIYTRGRNDASTAVQSTLRRLDTDGRTCGTADTHHDPPDHDARRAPRTRTSTARARRARSAPRTAPRAAARLVGRWRVLRELQRGPCRGRGAVARRGARVPRGTRPRQGRCRLRVSAPASDGSAGCSLRAPRCAGRGCARRVRRVAARPPGRR